MTNLNQPTTAVGLLADATLKAAIEIAISKQLDGQPNFADKLSEALKTTVKGELDRILEEWKQATETNLGNAWLKQLMTAQAAELAQQAVKSIS